MERPTQRPVSPTDDPTLHHPRILCLHGGGVNRDVFRAQARSLIKALPSFRLVFADGPFYCAPGPGIVPVGWRSEPGVFRLSAGRSAGDRPLAADVTVLVPDQDEGTTDASRA